MAGEADYAIVARIVAQDATMGGAASATRRIEQVEQRAATASRSIMASFRNAFAFIGGAAIFGSLIRGVGQWQTRMQEGTIAIATNMAVVNKMSMTDSMMAARATMKDLRKDAATGAGELQDYIQGFAAIYAPARQSGASNATIRELTKNAITAGAVSGRGGSAEAGMQQASLDVQQALTSGIGSRTTPIVMSALQAAGVTAAAFRAMSPAKKVAELNSALKAYAVGSEELGKTWGAQMATLKDNVMGFLGTLSQPLFDRWSTGLRNVNAWFVKNQKALEDTVNVWGVRLLSTWDSLIAKAGTYAAIVAGAGIGQSVSSAGGFGKMAKRALLAGTGGFTPGLMNFGAVLEGPFLALARLAGPIAIVTTVLLALKGAIAEYPKPVAFVRAVLMELSATFGKLGTSFDMLTGKGSALNKAGAVLLDLFGGMVVAVDLVVRAVSSLVTGLAVMFRVIGEGGNAAWAAMHGDRSGTQMSLDRMARVLIDGQDQLKNIWTWSGGGRKQSRVTDEELAGGTMRLQTPKNPDNILNVNGPVTLNLKTEANSDPGRAAHTLAEAMARLNQFRVQAKRLPAPTF